MLDGLGDGILPMVVFLEKVRCQNKSGKWITMGLIHFDNFHSKTTSFGPIDPVQVFFNHLDFSKRIKIVIYFYSIHSERVTSKAKQLRSGTMIFFNYIWDALDKRGHHIQDFRKSRTLEGHEGRVYWMHKTTRVERKKEIELERGKEEHKICWMAKKNVSKSSQELKLTPWILETFNFTPLDPIGLPLDPLGPCRPTPWPPWYPELKHVYYRARILKSQWAT